MTALGSVPLWLAIPIAALVMLGATITLIGAWGFLRLHSFYDRLHAPTLGSTWGAGSVVLASVLLASYLQDRPILHEIAVGLGVLVTVPVTLMLLGQAALRRDRIEHSAVIPDWLKHNPEPTPDTEIPEESGK